MTKFTHRSDIYFYFLVARNALFVRVIFSNLPVAGDPLLIEHFDYEINHTIHMWGRHVILFSGVPCNAVIFMGIVLTFFYIREEDPATRTNTPIMIKDHISLRTLKLSQLSSFQGAF